MARRGLVGSYIRVLLPLSRYGQRVSEQRARSAVAAGRRSIHPKIAGTPWWGAVLIATTASAVGFAFDAGSGNKELTNVFAGLYVTGCVLAVLAVRQSGVFTAVIQPPLLLFCAVPGAYWLFHGAKITGLKDTLINCGYPLIERFPLMLCTSAGVLLLGMIRWYLGRAARSHATAETESDAGGTNRRKGGIGAKLAVIWSRGSADDADKSDVADEAAAKAKGGVQAVGQAPKTGRSAGGARATRRSTQPRNRRARPPLDESDEPTVERARRRRPRPIRDVDADVPPPAVPRRRPRPVRDPDLRSQPPREIRRDPNIRSGRPAARSSRFDPYEPVDPYDLPPRRRPAAEAANRANSTHHPISQVRYRGASRPRGSQNSAAESWEYDI